MLHPRQKRGNIRQPIIDGDAARIPLTKGLFAIIDLADLPLVAGRNWLATPPRHGRSYARTTSTAPDSSRPQELMHRVICGISDPAVEADHRDGNGLNNRRENLRVCDRSRNSWNRGLESNSSTGYKGVYFAKQDNSYQASIRFHTRRFYLGRFKTVIEAALAYDLAAELAFGDYARLNFPSPTCKAHFIHPVRPPEGPISRVTDPDAFWKSIKSTPLAKATLTIVAQKLADSGATDIPGCIIKEVEVLSLM